MKYPWTRMRRARQHEWSRRLVRQNRLCVDDLVWPLFVHDGEQDMLLEAMPGVKVYSAQGAVRAAQQAYDAGITLVALFPRIQQHLKDPLGEAALNPQGLIPRTVRQIRRACPQLGIMADVALDPFTNHGHDGVLNEQGGVDNDATVARLVQMSLVLCQAGVHVIAPSDMQDGRIGAIREALEAAAYHDTIVLSYAAKYASTLYAPFREAVGSERCLQGDKSSYQMAMSQRDEALIEAKLDLQEGADWLMVKPASFYLDIISDLSYQLKVPVFAYQVSGEYSMLHAYAKLSVQDPQALFLENLLAIKRAGADAILSYAALDLAKQLA